MKITVRRRIYYFLFSLLFSVEKTQKRTIILISNTRMKNSTFYTTTGTSLETNTNKQTIKIKTIMKSRNDAMDKTFASDHLRLFSNSERSILNGLFVVAPRVFFGSLLFILSPLFLPPSLTCINSDSIKQLIG